MIVKRLISILAGVTVLWAVGLIAFISNLPRPTAAAPTAADGIVVYTGGGGVRITTGMAIFADGAGERLLISGVHPDTSAARLSELWAGPKERFDCCVDLGHEALTTEGNASELRDWALSHHYQNIILVTSDYHMPRAMLVTRSRMAQAAITPYAVASGYLNAKGRPTSFDALISLTGEYTKFLLARAKTLLPASGR